MFCIKPAAYDQLRNQIHLFIELTLLQSYNTHRMDIVSFYNVSFLKYCLQCSHGRQDLIKTAAKPPPPPHPPRSQKTGAPALFTNLHIRYLIFQKLTPPPLFFRCPVITPPPLFHVKQSLESHNLHRAREFTTLRKTSTVRYLRDGCCKVRPYR